MRFAQTARKFKGLHLCHQFFNDLMSLFGALSLNVAKERNQENGENGVVGHHPQNTLKSSNNHVPTIGGSDSVKEGSH